MSVANPVIDYIDGPNRRIYLRSGVRVFDSIDDIYKEVRELRSVDEALRQFDMFVESGGNIPRPGKPPTDRFLILRQGTKIVPANEDHTLVINTELFTDDAGDPAVIDFSPLSPGTNVFVSDSVVKSVLTDEQDQAIKNIQTIVTAIQPVVDAIKVVVDAIRAVTDWLIRWARADELKTPTNYRRRAIDNNEILIDKNYTTDGAGTENLTE